jgi:hypothetical protein
MADEGAKEPTTVPIVGPGGASAPAEQLDSASGSQIVNYYFPVEIVLVGGLSDDERRRIETDIWTHLSDALDGTGSA